MEDKIETIKIKSKLLDQYRGADIYTKTDIEGHEGINVAFEGKRFAAKSTGDLKKDLAIAKKTMDFIHNNPKSAHKLYGKF